MLIRSSRLTTYLLKFIKTKLFYSSAASDSDLPEFTYAGKNIKPHSRVYVMGVSTHGALGVRSFLRPPKHKAVYDHMKRPHRLEFADHFKVEDIACGYGFTVLALKNKDFTPLFFGTGINTNSQIGVHTPRKGNPLETIIVPTPINCPLARPSRQKKVSCGRAHTVIWTEEEGLWTFGNNSYGQCGRPIAEDENYAVRAHYHHIHLFDGRKIEQIECGQDTSFILCDGKLYSCGWSADGQCGQETYKNMDSFGLVRGDLKGENVIKISSKADCVMALTENGEVFVWGNSEYRQLGSITEEQQMNVPRKLTLNIPGKIIDVAASGTSCFAVTDAGEVWSWGYGILGVGPNTTSSAEPVRIPNTLLGRTVLNSDSMVVKIFAGTAMAAAVTKDGGLFTWGRNPGGALGLGHTNFQHFPMRVCVASSVVNVSCGVDHMVVLGKSLM